MALWIIFIPLIIFLNSFFIGKIYRRFSVNLNSYLTTLFGFITFFGIFGTVISILVLFTVNFDVFLYIFLAIQIIMIFLYIFNWKYCFISYNINFKKLFLIAAISLIVIVSFFVTKNYNDDVINWYNINDANFFTLNQLLFSNKNIDQINIFKFGQNYLRFDLINYLYIMFFYIFDVGASDILLFSSYLNFMIFNIMLALMLSYFYDSLISKNWWKVINIVLLGFIVSLISFSFNKYIWIILFSIFLYMIHTSKQKYISSSISTFLINFGVLSGCMFETDFLIVAFIINLIQFFISYKIKKQNATDYNILMFFSTLIFLSLIFDNSVYISLILLISVIILYAIYLMYRSSKLAKKVNEKLDIFLYQKINFVIYFFIFATFVVSIGLFLSIGQFKVYEQPWIIIDYSSEQVNKTFYYLINILYWFINVIILFYSLVKNNIMNIKINKKIEFKNKFTLPNDDISLLVIMTFWNPIATNLFRYINSVEFIWINLNLQTIFFACFIPFLISGFKNMIEGFKWKYFIANSSLILISTIIIISGINYGVLNV